MREIKFRVWNSNEKEFLNNNEFLIGPNGEIFPVHEHWDGFEIETDNDMSGSGWVIQRYTGLNDKNGKEIYEGDIVKVRNGATTSESYFVGDVVFEKGEFGHRAAKYAGSRPPYMFYSDDVLSIKNSKLTEIIGNIYENPELINS